MDFTHLPHITPPEWIGGAVLVVWGIYKKEIQEKLNACGKYLLARLQGFGTSLVRLVTPPPVERISDKEWDELLAADLEELETLLSVLLGEYKADRVTVTEYSESAGGHLATCAVEARNSAMPSVLGMQLMPLTPEAWEMIEEIHRRPGRYRYVPDVHTLEHAPLRAVLLNSGVWSAYYQSLSNGRGPRAMLSLSWYTLHPLSELQLTVLHISGIACAAIWRNKTRWKEKSAGKTPPKGAGGAGSS
ncbi:hypothetical protein [Hymenobacter nivis]|uniref:Uncharacterized protein n=1 Tax=Hymenobacter nivis TaxID=1850093 RepID=A0A502GVZ1_9BACT|nr:hypothetical protein [Hymenobacter nivis]TPG66054.1 hypothetical protein EAH73_11840 [Hymenobacter nivis]